MGVGLGLQEILYQFGKGHLFLLVDLFAPRN